MKPMLGTRAIISSDRVHPTSEGQHVMAQIFLHDINQITKPEFDTKFIFEDWNKERYDAEKKLELINLIELCIFNAQYREKTTLEEKKKLARKDLEEIDDKNSLMALAYREYLERIDIREQLIGEVIKLTL